MTAQRVDVPVEKDTNFFSISCEKFIVGLSSSGVQLTFCDDFADTKVMTLSLVAPDGTAAPLGMGGNPQFDASPVRIQYGRIKMTEEAATHLANTLRDALNTIAQARRG